MTREKRSTPEAQTRTLRAMPRMRCGTCCTWGRARSPGLPCRRSPWPRRCLGPCGATRETEMSRSAAALPCIIPLQALPGGAGCAAAGSLRPDNGARCGGGGSTAGAARLLSGALPMAEAVPCLRTVVRVGGGRANQKVARLTSLHEYYWCLHCPLS